MPRTARKIGNSGFYHIVARGIGKQIIFEEENDYLLFLGLLKKYLKEEDAVLHAYCLMDNHFHLLLKIDSGMDRLMKKISTAYVFYFNNKYERVGHLFQDRYRSIPVEDDSSLLSVVRYIHNNPAKAGICPAVIAGAAGARTQDLPVLSARTWFSACSEARMVFSLSAGRRMAMIPPISRFQITNAFPTGKPGQSSMTNFT